MSSTIGSTSATIQNLARTVMEKFDSNQDGQFSADEFTGFLDDLVGSVSEQAASTPGKASTAAAATSLFLSSAGITDSATTTGSAYRDRMLGFDYGRFENARGSLKYDAANLMQGINPGEPGAMQKVYEQLVKLHPGQVSIDKDGNLMLDGTADGYIGVRPIDRSENWDAAPSGYVWQWMAYNDAHPGPNGEVS